MRDIYRTNEHSLVIWYREGGIPSEIRGKLSGNVLQFTWKNEEKKKLFTVARGWVPAVLNLFRELRIHLDSISQFVVELDGRIVCR